MSAPNDRQILVFAGFTLDPGQRTLVSPSGEPVPLNSRAFDTLLFMAENPSELLEKKRLMEAVWPDTVVEENNLNQNISVLRKALGEAPGEHRFIVTIPGRGFRFVPAVTRQRAEEPAIVPAAAAASSPAPSPLLPAEPATPQLSRKVAWALAAAAGLAAIAITIAVLRRDHEAPPTREVIVAQPSIAVLPFSDVSPNKDQEYFADGLAEELLNQLAQTRELRVIGRSSSFSFKDKDKDQDLRAIGSALGVDHLLEGSVRKAGNDIRVTARLVDTRDGSQIWSGAYDRKLDDVFAIQAEIAKSVADSLSLTLRSDARSDGTRNPAAYDAYLAGIALLRRGGREATQKALGELQRAVELDPQFALAWTVLAAAYDRSPYYFLDTDAAATAKALRAHSRALELAPSSPTVLAAASAVSTNLHDWVEAERRLQKAISLQNGNEYFVNLRYGWFLFDVGRPREAIEYFRNARRAEPLLLQPSSGLENALTAMRDFKSADAERALGRNLIGDQYFPEGGRLIRILTARDRNVLQRELATFPPDVFMDVIRPNLDDPQAGLAGLRKLYRTPDIQANTMQLHILAHWAVYFGDDNLALDALRTAFGPGQNVFYLWQPDFKDVRALPGFKAIVRNLGLVDYWRASGKWSEFCKPAGAEDFECH